jgi:hypothetical protein
MPVVGARHRIPAPVRQLEIVEDDARIFEPLRRVTPDVEVAGGAARPRATCTLEPGVLVGGVVEDEFGDHSQAPAVRFLEENLEITQRSTVGMNGRVVGDVVAVITKWRGIEWQKPDRTDAKLMKIVELRGQAREVSDAVAVAIVKRADVELVDDGVLVPPRPTGPGSV